MRDVTIRIRNWSKHQHFKDRTPPWIKLYRDILDDPDWHAMSGDDAKLLVGLWLVASEDETRTGALPDMRRLAFRLRITESKLNQGLNNISHWLERDDIEAISACHRGDAPETETETEGEADAPTGATPPPKPKKAKTPERTFPAWVESIGDDDAIRADDPIFDWASKTGVPADWIVLAWWVFEGRYSDSPKKYADWRAVFRKAVREDWLKVWRLDTRDNRFVLTTTGELARREMEATA